MEYHSIYELHDAMSSDLGVMAEHGDSNDSLWQELINADADILRQYEIDFLEEE